MPGPPPKPTRLKLLAGNPGKRAINRREPQPDKGKRVPACPSWLDEEAKKVWKRHAKQLWDLGLLTTADVDALAALCECQALYMTAVEMIRKSGAVLKTQYGQYQRSPWIGIRDNAQKQTKAWMQEFGMTPSARSRIEMPPKKQEDPLEEFVGRARSASG